MTFDINKNSFALSINDDRYNFLCSSFIKIGLTPPTKFKGFEARKYGIPYVIANTYGQMSIVQYAKQNNLPYVVVFEDDALPRKDINSHIVKINESLSSINDVDVLYLGRNGDSALWNDDIEKIHHLEESVKNSYSQVVPINDILCTIKKNVYGTQSYVVFRQGYDRFILTMMIAMLNKGYRGYADIELSSSKFLKILHLVKPLFIQYNKDTGICNHAINLDPYSGYGMVEQLKDFKIKEFNIFEG